MKKIKTKNPAGEPPEKLYTGGPLISWIATSEWEAVYAVPEGERLFETSPLIGWALVGVPKDGTKRLIAEVAGVRAKIDEHFFLCGHEKHFLGYRQAGVNADEHFKKEALAYRERIKLEGRKGKL
ncbi:MAG: hypothetical protein A2X28_06445 [Elusimicrobia bacterium GWA2_56_46]|nr:MAG: hypothetical protein A2X28_06445 [Elusimicrobia bacterium GWA2_56_46]OGR54907.1 MAG: hypothetical protein A2X39_11545 [Elusimicrobia bacterium GWC2_56_31]HBW23297.1 hypothetical protein [Elusimicrobiota bacterium]